MESSLGSRIAKALNEAKWDKNDAKMCIDETKTHLAWISILSCLSRVGIPIPLAARLASELWSRANRIAYEHKSSSSFDGWDVFLERKPGAFQQPSRLRPEKQKKTPIGFLSGYAFTHECFKHIKDIKNIHDTRETEKEKKIH